MTVLPAVIDDLFTCDSSDNSRSTGIKIINKWFPAQTYFSSSGPVLCMLAYCHTFTPYWKRTQALLIVIVISNHSTCPTTRPPLKRAKRCKCQFILIRNQMDTRTNLTL